jgi:hypothetical protein
MRGGTSRRSASAIEMSDVGLLDPDHRAWTWSWSPGRASPGPPTASQAIRIVGHPPGLRGL